MIDAIVFPPYNIAEYPVLVTTELLMLCLLVVCG